MNNYIKIEFLSLPQIGASISFKRDNITESFTQKFVNSKSDVDETTIGIDIPATISNLVSSLAGQLDFGLFNVYNSFDSIYIESLSGNKFELIENATEGALIISIVNTNSTQLLINSITYSESVLNKCNKVDINIETNSHVDSYVINGVEYQNANDGLTSLKININRGFAGNITIKAGTYSIDFLTVAPSKLLVGNFELTSISTQSGSYLSVRDFDLEKLQLSYSLNDTDIWQDSSSFSEVTDYVGVIKIKDNFGCDISIDYVSEEFIPTSNNLGDFFSISDSMPIRFKNNVLWDCENNIKNQSNELSYEDSSSINYNYSHVFLPKDLVTMQFLSNYDDNKIELIETCSKLTTEIDKVLVNKFIGLKSKLTCNVYKSPLLKNNMGIYFTDGEILDYDTDDILEDYNYGGSLPDFASVGQLVTLEGYGPKIILDIIYDNVINCEVIILDLVYTGSQFTSVISSIYNQNNFDVYEFKIDMASMINKPFYIKISNIKEDEVIDSYVSEDIKIITEIDNYFEFEWDYENCVDVISTPKLKGIGYYIIDELEQGTKGDLVSNEVYTGVNVVDIQNYSLLQIKLDALPTAICRQFLKSLVTSSEIKSSSLPFPQVFSLSEMPTMTKSTPYLSVLEFSLIYY